MSYIGSIILGMGFTFDDDNEDATPLSEMHRILAAEPGCAGLVWPYIGGEEVNSSPIQEHRRFVINFGDRTLEEAKEFQSLFRIVIEKVKPFRSGLKRDAYRERWWQFGERQAALYRAIVNLDSVIAISRVSQHCAFSLLSSKMVFAETLVVFVDQRLEFFALLQSRVHEVWARFFSSSFEDRLRYSRTDCFGTFPLPRSWSSNDQLREIGSQYHAFRAVLMARSGKGLTDTYNCFHNRSENDPNVCKLRELHSEMDRIVLDCYGWTDLQPRLDFILDYEDQEGDEGHSSDRKKPWRYRWVDEDRDEVLARLLELNRVRSEEQARSAPAPASKTRGRRGQKTVKSAPAMSHKLFETEESIE